MDRKILDLEVTKNTQSMDAGSNICGARQFRCLGNGFVVTESCQFPKSQIYIDGDVICLEKCVFHTLEDINNHTFSPPEFGEVSEITTQLETAKDHAIEGVFDKEKSIAGFESLGTNAFPIVGYEFENIRVENLSRPEGLVLENCHVNGIIFLKNCMLGEFSFSGAGVDRLTFTNCTIRELRFTSEVSETVNIYLNNSRIDKIGLWGAEVGDVRLEDSVIRVFSLKGFLKVTGKVVSIRSKLNFFGGDFSSATVGVSDKVSFSRSKVRGCVFLTKNFDDWRRLKLVYNQNSSFLAVLLLVAFALPIALDVAYWQAVAGLQEAYQELTWPDNTPTVLPCLSNECKQVSLLWLVSGANQGILYVAMTVALLLLNVFRVILVGECAIIREWEDQAGLHPEKGTILPRRFRKTGSEGLGVAAWRLTYGRLMPLDLCVRSLLYVSIISFGINVWNLLQVQVLLPR